MGYHKHHAIVCTSWKEEHILKAHIHATETFDSTGAFVTPLTPGTTNGYRSFMIAPDGSKEGWDASDRGDAARLEFTAWLVSSGLYIDWFEAAFGGDDSDMLTVADDLGTVRRWETSDGWGASVEPKEADDA